MSNEKNQFKHTLNLPKTNFPMKANLSQNEPLRLKKWAEQNIYDSILSKTANHPSFIFHDGPPYANGDIHIGHLLNKVLKDVVVRSQYLLGNRCEMIPGWDCHGLPIEHKVLSELSPQKKEKLATLSPDNERLAIRNECQKYAEKFIKRQSDQMKRLLTLANYDAPYLTYQPAFEANVLTVFSKMVAEGIVFRQLKPVHWSIANQTALAEAELEYMDKTSLTVAVKFTIVDHPFSVSGPVNAVIWTTTPWTLPANLALAFGKKINYSLVKMGDSYGVIATERLTFIQTYIPDAHVIEAIDT
ncbi:MAG: class I tRNA ligase family protein, partial [Candidatus Marinamargulisbacteria bacterium]